MHARLVVLALLMNATLAGCTDAPTSIRVEDRSADEIAPIHINETSGASEFLRPQWTVGRWWNVELSVDNGYGFLTELRGRLVVSSANETGFRVGSDSEGIGVFDTYFDHFHVGVFDNGLNASIGGAYTRLFAWPLHSAQTWTTQYVLLDEQYGPRPYNVTLSTSTFDDAPATERIRVHGEVEHGPSIDYDYSAKTGWMTYFRMTNKTTGRIHLSIDFQETGTGHQGLVHHVRSTPLYSRIVALPPCDQRGCDPRVAGAPPTDRVMVPAGFDWVEEFCFLFVYPLDAAGAGEAAYAIVRPDLTLDRHVFPHAGDRFGSNWTRTQVRTNTAGEWRITIHAAGTAGALVLLLGFHDEQVGL